MNPKADFFNFNTSYFDLPERFYSKISFLPVANPEMILWNQVFAEDLQLKIEDCAGITEVLAGNKLAWNSEPFAQAYAGHQFGHFTMLGDGRATLLGEHLTPSGNRFDIQLKGSGRTPYSRSGDGKATLRSMLREYLMSEAMQGLAIKTSRSLAVVKTGEKVQREMAHEGAVLTRVMESHLRVGTFEFARYLGADGDVEKLLNYTIHRLFPTLADAENKALAFLEKVMDLQIDLVVNWMRVGFIHGVMNTDNTSISGETFDYGPCAFMGIYHPAAKFSSIDTQGRYAFENQPNILKWNLTRLAETLLPLISENTKDAIGLATKKINAFDQQFSEKWYGMMLQKLGINDWQLNDIRLLDDFLHLLQEKNIDYTNAFTYLRAPEYFEKSQFALPSTFQDWMVLWKERIAQEQNPLATMQKVNPVVIPKNYFVEEAIQHAENGDFSYYTALLKVLQTPYTFHNDYANYLDAPSDYDLNYCTFCGT